MRMALRYGLVLLVALIALAAVMSYRAMNLNDARLDVPAPEPHDYDAGAIAARLAEAVRIPTISMVEGRESANPATFVAFRAWLARTYPDAHAAMDLEMVNKHTLLFRWAGSGEGQPVAFLAHQDVVPIEPGTEDDWTHPPFQGVIDGGYVWGRGTQDCKASLIAIMEAANRLAAEGFRPRRDLYFFFGHDEEIGGEDGMAVIAEMMRERGIRLEWTLDEGSAIVNGTALFGVEPDVALISIGEKGYLTLDLVARDAGGHSSMPRDETAVSKLAKAVATLHDNQFPARLDDQTRALLRAIAAEGTFTDRLIMANLWLLEPLVKAQMLADPSTAARLRTTTAATIIKGGSVENILPQQARATVNFRIQLGESVDSVIDRVQTLVGDGIEVTGTGETLGYGPSTPGLVGAGGYAVIEDAVGQVFGPVIAVPSLTVAGTDSKHMEPIADSTYRFNAAVLTPDLLDGIHGTNERIPVDNLGTMAAFFEAVMRGAAEPGRP